MAVHYPEFMKSACETLGTQVASIDLGGAITYQGPVTAEQQAELLTLYARIAKENADLSRQVKAKMAGMPDEIAAKKAAKEAKKKNSPKGK